MISQQNVDCTKSTVKVFYCVADADVQNVFHHLSFNPVTVRRNARTSILDQLVIRRTTATQHVAALQDRFVMELIMQVLNESQFSRYLILNKN